MITLPGHFDWNFVLVLAGVLLFIAIYTKVSDWWGD